MTLCQKAQKVWCKLIRLSPFKDGVNRMEHNH